MPHLSPVLIFAGLWSAALAGIVLSAGALLVMRNEQRAFRHRADADWARCSASSDAAVESLTQRVASLAEELRGLQEQLPQARTGGAPLSGTGLDLTRRAQALRLHRRGDPPDQIAALLKIPLQEVDLLLKVHRIVLTNI